jgi:hypothetical protein
VIINSMMLLFRVLWNVQECELPSMSEGIFAYRRSHRTVCELYRVERGVCNLGAPSRVCRRCTPHGQPALILNSRSTRSTLHPCNLPPGAGAVRYDPCVIAAVPEVMSITALSCAFKFGLIAVPAHSSKNTRSYLTICINSLENAP